MSKKRDITLGKKAKKILRNADNKTISDILNANKRYIHKGRWIGSENRYRQHCIQKLKEDHKTPTRRNPKHLSEYIASSVPLHCVDGWSFLGRAVECYARGDWDSAIHLAYYSELRGALSLLASEGIGVFDRHHFILKYKDIHKKKYVCQEIPTDINTHIICWLVLDHWTDLSRSSNRIGKIISPGGVPFEEWLGKFQSSGSTSSITKDWLSSWGLDLRRMSKDRESRNTVSYRPTRLNPTNSLTPYEISRSLSNLWSIFNPQGESQFELLDKYLLRLGIEKAFKASTGRAPLQERVIFENRIDNLLRNLTPVSGNSAYWKDFLLRNVDGDEPLILTEALKTDNIGSPGYPIQIFSRAALLLRAATGVTRQLLVDTGISRNDLCFWWDDFGNDRGLWRPKGSPSNFADLWADVEETLEDLEQTSNGISWHEWISGSSKQILTLGSWERIAMWGFGL